MSPVLGQISDFETAVMAAADSERLVIFSFHERTVLSSYFEMHDVDGSRSLSTAELLLVVDDMDKLPPPGSEDEQILHALFDTADADRSGELDFHEFLSLVESYYCSVYI